VSAGEGDQAYHLADGLLVARGHGPARDLLDAHLEPAATRGPAVYVSVEFVASARGAGHVVETGKGRAVVQPPTDDGPVEVAWERAMATARPLVVAAHLAARRRGALLVHGATVAWGDRAVAIVGASGGGKTTAALEALRNGARLVAPEWIWVDVFTGVCHGLPQPLRLRPHHAGDLAVVPAGRGQTSLLRAARVLPSPVRRRVYVDVPFTAVAPAGRELAELVGLVVAGGPTAPQPVDPVAVVAAATADDAAGVASSDLIATLARRLRAVAALPSDIRAMAEGLR
jgi:hypothetical protein